jgi:hypothetical protein
MFATAKQSRTNAASRGFGRGAATHRRCRDRPHKGSAGRDQDDRGHTPASALSGISGCQTERRINRECPAAGGHFALANSPAVKRLTAGALAATQLAGVEPHQRRPQSSRQGALRDVAPTCPAGAMMLLIPWRVVAAESVAAKIDRRAPPISVLMMSGRRRSMELAPFAATGALHIAGAASELASGATRNLGVPKERGPVGGGNAAGSLARI